MPATTDSITQTPLILGIDAGTTRIRALAFDAEGKLHAQGSAPTPTIIPSPDWAEHAPEELWRACAKAIRDALSQVGTPNRVVGLAVASVGEAGVLLDAGGQPTYPAIAWFDKRAQEQLRFLQSAVGKETLFETTGLHPDLLFSLCKILWIRDNAPEQFARSTRWLNVADYLAWRLCGEVATDLSLASRTLALDLANRRWADAMLSAIDIPTSLFAPLTPSGTKLGTVTQNARDATGLPRHCAVGVGGHDHILGAMAAGAWNEGTLLDSLGTAEAILMFLRAPVFDTKLLARGFSQGALQVDAPLNYLAGAMTTSGACVEWFRRLYGGDVAHETLIAEGARTPAGANGVGFFPHMRIGSPPYPSAHARGAYFGLSPESDRGALYRALLEGIAYDAASVVDNMSDLAGVAKVADTIAIGGNSQNNLLMQIKATVYQRDINVVDMSEATSLGAALLGGLACGVYTSLDEALARLTYKSRVVRPVTEDVGTYVKGLRRFARAAHSLSQLHSA